MKTFLTHVLLAVLGTCVFSVTTPAYAEESIYIALSAPITGNYAEYGANFKRAIELGVDQINAQGGIDGRPIELIIGDSKGQPKESATESSKCSITPKN